MLYSFVSILFFYLHRNEKHFLWNFRRLNIINDGYSLCGHHEREEKKFDDNARILIEYFPCCHYGILLPFLYYFGDIILHLNSPGNDIVSQHKHSLDNSKWMKEESHANMLNVGSLMVSENHFFLSIICHACNGLFLSRSQSNDSISQNVPLSHFKRLFVPNKYCYHSILHWTA